MQRRLSRAFCLLIAAAFALPPAPSIAASPCLEGDCVNGIGTRRGGSLTEYTGPWVDSRPTAGTYSVRYPGLPGRAFELTIDAQRFPLRGSVARDAGIVRQRLAPTVFTGTFGRVYHPFAKREVPRFDRGTYLDTNGVAYEGDFDFIPSAGPVRGVVGAAMGYYLFTGTRIDEKRDRVTTGLHISDLTVADALFGEPPPSIPVEFTPADPDFIVKLREDLREEIRTADRDEAAKLATARESREFWSGMFTAAVGFAAVVGTARIASKMDAGPSSVSSLGDAIRGRQTTTRTSEVMVADLRTRAKGDPVLAQRIGNASDAEVMDMMRKTGAAPPATLTVAEYRAAKAGTPSVRPAQARIDPADEGGRMGAGRAVSATAAVSQVVPVTPAPTGAAANEKPREKRIEWEAPQPEALAICQQSARNGKWRCSGALDTQLLHSSATVEEALERQYCANGEWAAAGPVIDGEPWQAYRCGKSLGYGDHDITRKHLITVARRFYICQKGQLGDHRCTTLYDGQDKR